MEGYVTDVTYKRARHQNENHQNACSFFGLLLIPYSLFFTPCSLLLLTPPYSSLLLLILLILLIPLIPPYSPYSSLFLLPPFCKTSL